MSSAILIGWAQVLGSFVTAAATIALVYFTSVLTRETKRLADIGHQPHIVVSIEARAHSSILLHLVVANTGTATAYDVEVESRPEFPRLREDRGVPLRQVSLIKPNQELSTILAYYEDLSREPYTIIVSWAKSPNSVIREGYEYQVDVSYLEGMTIAHDDLHDISRHLEHIREDWRRVASGSQRISVNAFDARERLRERRENQRWLRERRRQAQANSPQNNDDSLQPEEEP